MSSALGQWCKKRGEGDDARSKGIEGDDDTGSRQPVRQGRR